MVASANRSAEEQLKLAEDLIAQGVDALVLNPVGDEIVPKIVQLTKEANIPLICVDNTSPGEGYTYIGIDNFAIARGIGQYIGEKYDGGNVVYVRSTATDTGCPAFRFGGIMGGISDEGEVAKFNLIDERYAMSDVGESDGMKQMEELLAANDVIDIVIAHHDGQGLGALTAIENSGRTDIKVMAGFDGELKLMEAIKENQGGENGVDIVTGLNSPTMIAEMTLNTLSEYFSGNEINSSYYIPVIIVSYENVDEYMQYGF
jgi:ribose transport system substrate-binding protein